MIWRNGLTLGAFGALALITAATWSWGLSLSFEDVDQSSRDSLNDLRRVPTETEIEVNAGSAGRWTLAEGFETPEDDGAWVSSLRARMVFEVMPREAPTSASIRLVPLLAPSKPARSITVSSSADRQTVELLGGGDVVSVALDGLARQQLVIDCDSVDSPLDLGVGADKRQLCVKVTHFTVMTEDG